MNINSIRLGSAVLYRHKTYMVVGFTLDKLQLVECDRFTTGIDLTALHYKMDKAFYARTSLCEPIPLLDVINKDHRFKPSVITLPDKTEIEGVTFNTYDGREIISLFPDSKYVGTYRAIIKSSDYTGNNKSAYMLPISWLHELQNVLNEVCLHITFSTVWK